MHLTVLLHSGISFPCIINSLVVEVGLEQEDLQSIEIHGGMNTVTACVAMRTGVLERPVQVDIFTIDRGYCKGLLFHIFQLPVPITLLV